MLIEEEAEVAPARRFGDIQLRSYCVELLGREGLRQGIEQLLLAAIQLFAGLLCRLGLHQERMDLGCVLQQNIHYLASYLEISGLTYQMSLS